MILLSLLIFVSLNLFGQLNPLEPMPGVIEEVTLLNATNYKLAGYCKSGNGDVSIEFGNLNFTAPCNIVTGIYYLEPVDVSAEVSTSPIQQCITQPPFAQVCSNLVTNFLAEVLVSLDPLTDIDFNNASNYSLSGTCSENGEEVNVNIGGITPTTQPECLAGVWSVNLNVISLPHGNTLITINHSDSNGNSALTVQETVQKIEFNLASDISGLQLWLDAKDNTTLWQSHTCSGAQASTNGDQIGCWQDKSGNSNHATEANTSRKPSFVTGGRISFDGGDSFNAGNVLSGAISELYVFKLHREDIRNSHTDLNLNHPQTGCGAATRRVSIHTPWGNGNIYWDAGTCSGNNRIFVGGQVVTGQDTIFGFESSISRSRQSIMRNSNIVQQDSSGHNLNLTGTAQIGGNTGMGAGLIGEINELIVIDEALTDSEIQVIEGHLACNWQLRDQLSTTHPYFHINPSSSIGCP